MTLLDACLEFYTQNNNNIPKHVVICTHAKESVVELSAVLITKNILIDFYPVVYSKDVEIIRSLKKLGVTIIEDEKTLATRVASSDAIIEDGARISKAIVKKKIALKQGFFSVEQTPGGTRYFSENKPNYPVINVARSDMVENSQIKNMSSQKYPK